MTNPLMKRLLGEATGDVVPVIANLPRETFRNRMVKNRQIETDEGEDDSVQRMVGEAEESEDAEREEGVIPADAEEVDPTEMTVGKPLRQPKEVVQEPSHPTADKEKYQTPYAALTAPDVTPQSMQPIDPSQVPGSAGPERFRAADLGRAQPTGEEPTGEVAAKAMDVLLGRNRAARAASGEEELEQFQQAGAVAPTEEEAAQMMGVSAINEGEAKAKAASMMMAAKDGGSAMPDPTPQGDGRQIYSAFRRFAG